MKQSLQEEKLRNKLNLHSKVLLDTFIILLWITSVFMFVIIFLGSIKICHGIYLEFKIYHETENLGIIRILEGLEFLFVSPLSYLLMLSITKYVFATKLEINPSLDIKQGFIQHSILEITNVKIYTVGLFISLLFLHSIKLILKDTMIIDKGIYIILILSGLIAYYFALDHAAEKLKK